MIDVDESDDNRLLFTKKLIEALPLQAAEAKAREKEYSDTPRWWG